MCVWLRHVTVSCGCVSLSLSDSCGGFPEDDPGGREDGRRCAARKNVLLHDVEPPNQHTGHCTGISRYLKASCQFSSTSADSTPSPTPQGPKYPILCIYGSDSTVIYQYFQFPIVILVFLCVFDLKDEWWFPCLIFPTIHPSSISVLGTDAKHRTSFRCIRKNVFSLCSVMTATVTKARDSSGLMHLRFPLCSSHIGNEQFSV